MNARGNPKVRQVLPLGLVLVAVLSVSGWAAEKVRFRDLCVQYLDEGKGEDIAKLIGYELPAAKVVALKYKVLLYEKGAERIVDPKTFGFTVGDRVRLSVEPYTKSYIYIFHVGASKKQVFLYPRKGREPKAVEAAARVSLPEDGFFEFVQPPGDERLLVVASEKPITDLDVLGRVLSKHNDPNATFTPEEQAIQKWLNATVEANLKSFQEKQIEKRDQVVRFRSLGGEEEPKELAGDVRARQPKSATLELPKANDGTLAVCLVLKEGSQGGPSSFLVTIPLNSAAAPKP